MNKERNRQGQIAQTTNAALKGALARRLDGNPSGGRLMSFARFVLSHSRG